MQTWNPNTVNPKNPSDPRSQNPKQPKANLRQPSEQREKKNATKPVYKTRKSETLNPKPQNPRRAPNNFRSRAPQLRQAAAGGLPCPDGDFTVQGFKGGFVGFRGLGVQGLGLGFRGRV